MKTITSMALLVCLLELSLAAPGRGGTRPFPRPKRCPRNEMYRACVSSSCAEATCQKPTVGPACTADCRSGCFCEDGFFRNGAQLCVRRDQCP
ncbi:hypothetical protein HPB47_020365 [Ixodes persulcatus]|uniref:Uncharacterized protein n=1 Tax=Ixodes persulcatus TaxID=34615 RepID=A0AC60QJ61_IXOPE|nr:hypothetical protein HPB47_020365 [Ixodes persulcatus]